MPKINEYPQAATINNNDLFVIDQQSGGDHSTKSASVSQIADKATSGVQSQIGSLSQLTTTDKSSLVGAVNEIASYTPVYGNTASGAIATFDTSLALPLQDCTIDINAVQEGSGTPSPDNVRPITGFTGANIRVADNETPHIIDNVTAITWQSEAGTVYGGLLDVTTGVLTVDRASVTLNGSEEWHSKTGITNIFSYSDPSIKDWGGNLTAVSKIMADTLPTISQTAMVKGTYGICNFSWGHQICVRVENISASADLKTYLTSNPLQAVYELATPTTVQLTPTQISAIVGTNNVFTDTNGDTSVVYACSLKDYIDRQ